MASDGEGFFEAILSLIMFPVMLSLGQVLGIYDWIKLHIDGRRYGLGKNNR